MQAPLTDKTPYCPSCHSPMFWKTRTHEGGIIRCISPGCEHHEIDYRYKFPTVTLEKVEK